MNILTRYTSRDYLRNGKLNLVGGNVSYVSGGYGGSIMSGNYLPATPNGDGTYTVDLSQVTFNGHIVASGEVSAYGSGSTSGGSTGSIDIEDNLTSERTDAALSANQGKVLKELIDNIDIPEVDLSNYYTKSQVDTKLDNLDIPEVDLSNYYNKTETDTKLNNKLNQSVWDNVFEVNSDGSLKVKVNLYGEGEISAYGSGTTGNTTLDLDNYYTKDEIDDKLDNIECTGGTEVDLSNYYTKAQVNTKLGGYSETSHTHTDYVSTVKVGTTDYAVKDNVISIPAYPTLTTLSAASSTDLTNHTANTTAHITATERTNWNNKLNKSVWDDVFEINEDGSLKVKVNLYGEGEISAYGSGTTGNTTLDLDNYYTKDEIDDKLDNIECTGGTEVDLTNYYTKAQVNTKLGGYSETSHTHSNYSVTSHTHSNYSLTSHSHSNYSTTSHTHSYLPLTGGTVNGIIQLNDGGDYISYPSASAVLGFGTSSTFTGADSTSGTVVGSISYSTILRSSGNDLYHYRNDKSTKYLILDSSNYTTYCATTSHTHSNYSLTSHSHSNYSVTSHTHALSALTSTAHTHTTIVGNYTANGGQQPPNYFGKNRVGALMMGTTVNGNSQYKDWLFMDCYSGNDVGGGVAFGVNRQTLGAYIMRSASGRTSWAESAELLGTHNWSTYCAAKSHTHSTLTFSAGAFGANSYNGGSAVTVSVPTHTSHITNNSGYITTGATVAKANQLTTARTLWRTII